MWQGEVKCGYLAVRGFGPKWLGLVVEDMSEEHALVGLDAETRDEVAAVKWWDVER